jgi:hypothetical protein
MQNFKGRHDRRPFFRVPGIRGGKRLPADGSEEIGDADDQQTTRSNKQNFEANNARPHGGAMRERPRGDAASARWVRGGLGDDSDLFSPSTTTLYQISLQPRLES